MLGVCRKDRDVEQVFDTYSESTNRRSTIFLFESGEYHVYFYEDDELVGDDWRDTLESATAAAEDWILYVE